MRSTKAIHPLRMLRQNLGSSDRPFSVAKLAQLTGIPAPTLQGVENGSRGFNADLQQRLRWRGVNWDEKRRNWTFTYNPKLPLTVDLLATFGRLSRGSDFFQDLDAESLCIQIVSLLQAVPAQSYNACISRFRDFLEQLRSEYGVETVAKTFAENTPTYHYAETASGAQTLVKSYPGKTMYESRQCLDLRYLRKSPVDVEFPVDEPGEPALVVEPAA